VPSGAPVQGVPSDLKAETCERSIWTRISGNLTATFRRSAYRLLETGSQACEEPSTSVPSTATTLGVRVHARLGRGTSLCQCACFDRLMLG
jgi:hypothetical protein